VFVEDGCREYPRFESRDSEVPEISHAVSEQPLSAPDEVLVIPVMSKNKDNLDEYGVVRNSK
jgi:hypothetical protein